MIEGASAAPNDKKMQQQSEEHFHPSPSFSTYSSETLAEIAARVINELRFDPQNDNDNDNDDDPLFQPWEEEEEENDFTITHQNDDRHNRNDNYNEKVNDDEDDFSFEFVSRDANTSPVSADDIFCNGQIRPMYMYPLFNNNNNNAPLNDAVYSGSVIDVPNNSSRNEPTRRRLPLRKLMFEEREETGTSCSSSEASESVDLEGVPEGTYCVWNPNAAVVRDRKKSSSTGSSNSKRWKLRELLLRSLSEGGNKGKKNSGGSHDDDIDNDKKRGFAFGVPGKRTSKVAAAAKTGSGDGYGGAAAAEREGKSGGRKKSVLPYSRPQELVGIFANVNGLGRNLNPF